MATKLILTNPKTGKKLQMTQPTSDSPNTAPPDTPITVTQVANAPRATAHHPDMNFDGGLDTYSLPAKA